VSRIKTSRISPANRGSVRVDQTVFGVAVEPHITARLP
jgi:hypothetical protein